jgi:DHA2 family multidrug resistance protein-like MFS transporter
MQQSEHPRRWAILAVLAFAVFVVSIDSTVLNVALPTLGRELHASTSALQWMVDAYSLALAGFLLLAGSLSDRFGRKRLLVIGLLLFGAASLAAVFSQEAWQLIAARAVMGIGASAFMPGTLSILVHVFSEKSRPKAIGIWGAVTALGAVIGPLVGGALLQHFWWGSLYLVNVIVVGVAVLGAMVLVPESSDPAARRIDPLSTVLSIVGVTGVVYGIIEEPTYGWHSPRVYVALAGGALVLVLFLIRQAFARYPMIDLKVAFGRRFIGASGTMAVLMFALTGSLFVLTQQFQLGLGYSPLLAGAAILPVAAALMVCSPLAPLAARALGTKGAVALSLVVLAAGYGYLAEFTRSQGYAGMAVGMVLIGIGMGISQPLVNDVLMSAGPPERSGLLSSMNDTVQELGAALGVAVIGSVLAVEYTSSYTLDGPPSANESFGQALTAANGLPQQTANAVTDAAHNAFANAFSVSTAACAGVVLLGAIVAAILVPRRTASVDVTNDADGAVEEPAAVGDRNVAKSAI